MTTDKDMWALPSVYTGARSPEGVVVTIRRGATDLNLVDVTAVRLRVRHDASGHERVWPTSVVQRWVDKLIVRHEFAEDGTDVRETGRYRILPELEYYVPGATPSDPPVLVGVRRAQPFYLAVLA
jgi:hypothetical protein